MIKTKGPESRFRRWLLKSVSAGALIALSGPLTIERARAADFQTPSSTHGFWMELGGMYAFWENDKKGQLFNFFNNMPPRFYKEKDGFQVFGGMGFNLSDTGWSFAFRGKGGATEGGEASSFSYFQDIYTGQTKARASHVALDFEIGRDVGLGALGLSEADLKLKFGVRYAQLSAIEKTKTHYEVGAGYSGSYNNHHISRLIGPRIGFESSVPLGDSSFSFDLNAAGAILFGKRKTKQSSNPIAIFGDQDRSFTRKKSATVANVDAFAGISVLMPGHNSKISIGYSVDAYFNALDVGYDSAKVTDRIIHGPAFRFTLQLP